LVALELAVARVKPSEDVALIARQKLRIVKLGRSAHLADQLARTSPSPSRRACFERRVGGGENSLSRVGKPAVDPQGTAGLEAPLTAVSNRSAVPANAKLWIRVQQ
jgi:hypothetical protein